MLAEINNADNRFRDSELRSQHLSPASHPTWSSPPAVTQQRCQTKKCCHANHKTAASIAHTVQDLCSAIRQIGNNQSGLRILIKSLQNPPVLDFFGGFCPSFGIAAQQKPIWSTYNALGQQKAISLSRSFAQRFCYKCR